MVFERVLSEPAIGHPLNRSAGCECRRWAAFGTEVIAYGEFHAAGDTSCADRRAEQGAPAVLTAATLGLRVMRF